MTFIPGSGGGGGGGNVVVLQPGGSAGGNVYTDFPTAYAALILIKGDREFFLDDSFGTPVVPPGVYLIGNATRFVGPPRPSPTLLQIQEGAYFDTIVETENVFVQCQNTSTPIIQYSGGSATLKVKNGAWQSGSAPSFDVFAFGAIFIEVENSQVLAGSAPVVQMSGGADTILTLFGCTATQVPSSIQSGSITDDGTCDLSVAVDDISTYNTQPGFSGSLQVTFLALAAQVSYAPSTPGDWSPPPTAVGGALDQLAARPGGGGGGNVIVFQPGGTPGGNVYTSWASAYAALTAIEGFRMLDVDISFGTATVPAGTYTIGNDTRIYSRSADGLATLNFDEGAVFDVIADTENISLASSNTATPVVTINGVGAALRMRSSSISPGAAPFFSVIGGGELRIEMFEGSALFSGAAPVIQMAGASDTALNIFGAGSEMGFSSVQSDTITDDGTCTLVVTTDDVGVFDTPQSGFTGTLTGPTLVSLAAQVSYTPATPGDWSPTPSEAAAALDQLAARPAAGLTFQDERASFEFSSIDCLASLPAGAFNFSASGGYTVGTQFVQTKYGMKVVGVLTIWDGPATTLKASLWTATGGRFTFGSAAVSTVTGGALFYIPFGTPLTFGENNLNQVYIVSVWDESNNNYMRYQIGASGMAATPALVPTPSLPLRASPQLTWTGWTQQNATPGDTAPTNTTGLASSYFMVDPVFQEVTFATGASFVQPAPLATVTINIPGYFSGSGGGPSALTEIGIEGGGKYRIVLCVSSGGDLWSCLNISDNNRNGVSTGATVPGGAVVHLLGGQVVR